MSVIRIIYGDEVEDFGTQAFQPIEKELRKLIKDIEPKLASGENSNWEIVFDFLEDDNAKIDGSRLYVSMKDQNRHVVLERIINVSDGTIIHTALALDKSLQGQKLSDRFMALTVELRKSYKLKTATLHANIDIGSYTWLRKGAIPDGGYATLANIIEVGPLRDQFIRRTNGFSQAEFRSFVFSKEFREYKPAFLNRHWYGEFNLEDRVTRVAMLRGASAASSMVATLTPKVATLTPKAVTALTTNEEILDRYIRHQTYLLRYAGGLRNQVLPMLAKTEKGVYEKILSYVAKAEGNRTLTGAAGRKWQSDFEKVLRKVRAPGWENASSEITEQLKRLAVAEAATGATIIQGASTTVLGLAIPPAEKLIAIVNSQPFEGRTLKEWLARTEEADVQRLLTHTKTGIIRGLTPSQIARSSIGTQAAGYGDGIVRKSFKDIESVILTLTNGIQNEAKQALYQANSDIIKKEMYVATLDVRTTIECAGLDGQVFPQGEGPIPPLHFRCRSLRVPYLNPDNFGDRGFDERTEKKLLQEYTDEAKIANHKDRGSLPRGHKTKYDEFARRRGREMVGTVPAQTTYNEWLKKQTNDFQDQVLGPTRADMFRNGNVSLDKFVARDGDVLTLDELRKKGLEVPD